MIDVFDRTAATRIENLNMAMPGRDNAALVVFPRQVRRGVRWSF